MSSDHQPLKRKRDNTNNNDSSTSAGKKPGRASVACLQCRRLKTRCHPGTGRLCLRCETLKLDCSFQDTQVKMSVNDRLNWLEEMVEQLLSEREKSVPVTMPPSRDESTDAGVIPFVAPISKLHSDLGLAYTLIDEPMALSVSVSDAVPLLESFYNQYERWVSTPQESLRSLAIRLQKESPLLLTVACLLGNRHVEKTLPQETEELLLHQMTTILGRVSISTQHTLETIQAMTLVAIYSSTLSKFGHQLDSWHLTGTAMQLYILLRLDNVPEFGDELASRRSWNHLCLSHVSYSVDWNRPCMIDDERLNKCVRTMDLIDATNHDGRMVAEISLYVAIYKILNASVNGEQAEEELDIWRADWRYLFEQEQSQYLEIGYYYGLLLAWERVDRTVASGYALRIVDRALLIPVNEVISVSNHVTFVIVYAGLFVNDKKKLKTLYEFLHAPSVGMQQDRRWDWILYRIYAGETTTDRV